LLQTDKAVVFDKIGHYLDFRGHRMINHIISYAEGQNHTNTIENAFSLLKRGMYGTFHKVSIKHLGRYCNEFSYGFNRRGIQLQMFDGTLKNLVRGEGIALQKAHGFDNIGALEPRLPVVFIFLRGSGFALRSLARAVSNFCFSTFILATMLTWVAGPEGFGPSERALTRFTGLQIRRIRPLCYGPPAFLFLLGNQRIDQRHKAFQCTFQLLDIFCC
jgi:ISXO2-like transposase domain